MNAVKSEVELFHFEDQQVRTVTQNGEHWFVLADLCKVLGFSNPSMVKKRLDQLDLSQAYVENTRGQYVNSNIVNESGMYAVIMRSELKSASRFQRWVTSEVLPSIRKHGGYLTESKIEEALLNPDVLIQLAQNLKDEQEKRVIAEAERAAAEALKDKVEAENKVLAPKAKSYEKLVESDGAFDYNRVAKNIGLGRNTMLAALRDRDVLMDGGDLHNVPYQKYMKHFEVKIHHGVTEYGREFTGYKVRVKPSGVAFILNKLADLVEGWAE